MSDVTKGMIVLIITMGVIICTGMIVSGGCS